MTERPPFSGLKTKLERHRPITDPDGSVLIRRVPVPKRGYSETLQFS